MFSLTRDLNISVSEEERSPVQPSAPTPTRKRSAKNKGKGKNPNFKRQRVEAEPVHTEQFPEPWGETFVPMVVEEDALSFTDAAPVLGDLETTPYPLASMTGGSLLSTPSFTFPSEEERPAETPATIIIEELKAKLNAETNLRHHYAVLTENYRYVINSLTKDGLVSQQYLNYIAGFDTVE